MTEYWPAGSVLSPTLKSNGMFTLMTEEDCAKVIPLNKEITSPKIIARPRLFFITSPGKFCSALPQTWRGLREVERDPATRSPLQSAIDGPRNQRSTWDIESQMKKTTAESKNLLEPKKTIIAGCRTIHARQIGLTPSVYNLVCCYFTS